MATVEKLTAVRVRSIFEDCLFQPEEDKSSAVKAEGLTINVGFHPDRLNSHKEEITEMLCELPEEFRESGGGGWSFLNACNDKHGNQWTGMHRTMEQLFLLGIAAGKVKLLMPRDMWKMFHGGMPYYVVLD